MKKLLLNFSVLAFLIVYSEKNSYSQTDIESGKAKQKIGNHSEAIFDFSNAIKRNDAETQKYLKLLEEYDKLSAYEKAEKGMEAPPVDVNFAVPYYLRGYSYSVTGKNAEAINDLTTALKINSKMGAAYFERGKLLWSSGKKDEACIDLGMAGSLKDSMAREMFDERFCWKEAEAVYKDASSKVRLNDFQSALDAIQKTIKLCPDSANYIGLRGRAYLGLGKYDLAMQDFDKAISLSQNSVDAWYGRGVAYYSKSKWPEAFDDFSKAINLDSKFASAYLYRAYTCEGMEKNQSALYDYQQVQRLKPGDALAYFKSGMLRNSMNDVKGACNDFIRAASMGYMDAQDYAEKCNQQKKKK